MELKHEKAEKSNGHSSSGISPPLHRFFRPQTAEARQTAARGRGGVLAAVVWSSEARRISHACCKPTADAQTAGHGRGRSPEVQSSKGSEFRGSEFSSSEFSSSEFWGTESRGRAAARSSGAPSPEAGQQLGVLGHRVQRQGSRSAGRKTVNEFEN